MSRSSFPRPEHARLLHAALERALRLRGLDLEVVDERPDQYRCRYRFLLHRRGAPDQAAELAIHFQIAERLEAAGEETAELARVVDSFLREKFRPGEPRP